MISKNKIYSQPGPNQLQFNLGIPLTTQNLVTHFHQPSPIMIERIGGQNAIPGGVKQPIQENLNASAASSCNFSVLSEERMARLSQLAQRNLKNMKTRAQLREKSSGHPLVQGRQKSAGSVPCSRQRKDGVTKPTRSTRSKEVAKNRPVGDVQTPPRPARPVSYSQQETEPAAFASNASVASKKKDTFFPVKAVDENKKMEAPKGELGKVQMEIENSLTILKQIGERALADGGATDFLQPLLKGKERDGFLYQEEGLDRARHRSEEQKTRFTRTLYNLRQRVKHLQRETTQADLNIPTQKRHVQNQLVVMYRHVSQALHTFLNQLAFQDLTYGLPTHYSELNLMIQQLTVLGKALNQETDSDGQSKILHILDDIDAINSQWSSQSLHDHRQGLPHGKRKNTVTKEWVSDTKVEADLFAKMESALGLAHHPSQRSTQPHPQKRLPPPGRPKKRAPGKENKRSQDKRVTSKKGTASTAGQSHVGFIPVGSAKVQPAPSVAWEVNLGKSVMLPTNLIAQREKARRAVELSKQNEPNFSEPTVSSKLKTSSQRSSSAPASQSRRKEVNFDLDHKTLLPWIPAGSGPYRPRSASLEQRSFWKEMDLPHMRPESLNYSPRTGSLKMPGRDRGDSRDHGFLSLPAHQGTRYHQVSDSFLESVEQRLFDRLMQRKVADSYQNPSSTHSDQMAQSVREQDEALDITDLYVEADSSLNNTNTDVKEMARKKAVGLMDAPTLENIKLRLDDMQRKQQEIRMRWSTVKFVDRKPTTRKTCHDYPPEPGVLHVEKRVQQQTEKDDHSDFNKSWSEDPLLFTKAYLDHSTRHRSRGQAASASVPTKAPVSRPKQLVSMKQTVVERLVADRDKFESFLLRRSHHPSGKFDPWTLMEEISDEILMDCLQDVSEEVEKINEEIANHMYKSEFMVTGSPTGGMSMASPPDFSRVPQRFAADRQQATDDREAKGYPHPAVLSDEGREDAASKTGSKRPLVVASEPLLEDISQFMSSRMEEKRERSKVEVIGSDEIVDERQQASGRHDDGGDKEEDQEEEDDIDEEDDDDDDDNYSDDDFEDVSDVEL